MRAMLLRAGILITAASVFVFGIIRSAEQRGEDRAELKTRQATSQAVSRANRAAVKSRGSEPAHGVRALDYRD